MCCEGEIKWHFLGTAFVVRWSFNVFILVIKWYSEQDENWKDLLHSKVLTTFIKYNFIKEYEWLILSQLSTQHYAIRGVLINEYTSNID